MGADDATEATGPEDTRRGDSDAAVTADSADDQRSTGTEIAGTSLDDLPEDRRKQILNVLEGPVEQSTGPDDQLGSSDATLHFVTIDDEGYKNYDRTVYPDSDRQQDVLEVLEEYLDNNIFQVQNSDLVDSIGDHVGNPNYSSSHLSPVISVLACAGAIRKVAVIAGQEEPIVLNEPVVRDLAPGKYDPSRVTAHHRVKGYIGALADQDSRFNFDEPKRESEIALMAWLYAALTANANKIRTDRPHEVAIDVRHVGKVGTDAQEHPWLEDFPIGANLQFDRGRGNTGRYVDYVALIDVAYRNLQFNMSQLEDAVVELLLDQLAVAISDGGYGTVSSALSRYEAKQALRNVAANSALIDIADQHCQFNEPPLKDAMTELVLDQLTGAIDDGGYGTVSGGVSRHEAKQALRNVAANSSLSGYGNIDSRTPYLAWDVVPMTDRNGIRIALLYQVEK